MYATKLSAGKYGMLIAGLLTKSQLKQLYNHYIGQIVLCYCGLHTPTYTPQSVMVMDLAHLAKTTGRLWIWQKGTWAQGGRETEEAWWQSKTGRGRIEQQSLIYCRQYCSRSSQQLDCVRKKRTYLELSWLVRCPEFKINNDIWGNMKDVLFMHMYRVFWLERLYMYIHVPQVAFFINVKSLQNDSECSHHWFHHTELQCGLRGGTEQCPHTHSRYSTKSMWTL